MWGPTTYDDPSNEFSKILNMGSISFKKHEMEILYLLHSKDLKHVDFTFYLQLRESPPPINIRNVVLKTCGSETSKKTIRGCWESLEGMESSGSQKWGLSILRSLEIKNI